MGSYYVSYVCNWLHVSVLRLFVLYGLYVLLFIVLLVLYLF